MIFKYCLYYLEFTKIIFYFVIKLISKETSFFFKTLQVKCHLKS